VAKGKSVAVVNQQKTKGDFIELNKKREGAEEKRVGPVRAGMGNKRPYSEKQRMGEGSKKERTEGRSI